MLCKGCRSHGQYVCMLCEGGGSHGRHVCMLCEGGGSHGRHVCMSCEDGNSHLCGILPVYRQYGFNLFALSLNEHDSNVTCPTDTRFRPDQRLLENADVRVCVCVCACVRACVRVCVPYIEYTEAFKVIPLTKSHIG